MFYKKLQRQILPVFMSITLLAGTLSPLEAIAAPQETAVSDNSVTETTYAPEYIQETESKEDVNTSADSPADMDAVDIEEENALSIEQAEGTITIRFLDEDGVTLLHAPVEKDLSVISASAPAGRYIFDTIDENGASVVDAAGFYALPYIRNGRRIDKWLLSGTTRKRTIPVLMTALFKHTNDLIAVYDDGDYEFSISYDLDGGDYEFAEGVEQYVPDTFTIHSEKTALPSAYKSGYIFRGWKVMNKAAGDAYDKIISEIPAGTYIDYTYGETLDGAVTGYQLKAVYEKIVVDTPAITYAKNTKSGVATIKLASSSKSSVPTFFELCYSTNSKFKKTLTHTVDIASKTSYKITNMPKGKTYYIKARAYTYDAKDNKVYSAYSPVTSLKIKKGVSEVKKSSKSSAKLTAANVKIDSRKNLTVTAKVKKRLKSYDDFYYLVSVDPCSGKILKAVANSDKTKTAVFSAPVRDEKGTNLINGKYAVAIRTGKKKFKQISSAYYIANPEAAADYTAAYPITQSKKGIQGSLDSKELGVRQGFTNFSINEILSADQHSGTKYVYNGKTYYFKEPYSLISYASACNQSGITCSAQLMLNWPGTGKYGALLFGTKSASSKTNLYAINASTTKSRELVEAAFTFLADRLSRENCHVDNWILGNEVNIYKDWYYAGSTGHDAFMKNYANSFRILYNSVKGRSRNARVFICVDHTWKNRSGDWGAKPFMESFNQNIKAMNKNIKWNLAYHAYPAILYQPATWRDSLAPNSTDADFVTPRNLNILTDYVKKTYGKSTRIIISECGFTNAEGEATQAAALAYSFYKAQFNDMVDAFIIRTVNDVSGERLTKLNGEVIEAQFGLCNAAGKKRASYNVFKYMDTPDYAKYTNSCLKTIGSGSWSDIIPSFSDKTLKSMPGR